MKKCSKKIGIFLMIIGILTMFVGCSTKDVKPVRTNTAEEVMNLFNQYNVANDVENMVALYSDVYLDSVGYTSGQVVTLLKNNRKGAKITKSETESIEAIDENTQKAVVNMGLMEDGEEKSYTYTYALIKEENGWSISPDGVIRCTDIDVPQTVKGELNLNLSKIIKLLDGYIIRVNIENDTSNAYNFGGEGNVCDVIVNTTEGEFITSMETEVKLDKRTRTYFMAKFEELQGDVEKITLTNIYDVKDDAVVEGSGREIIVYEKKN